MNQKRAILNQHVKTFEFKKLVILLSAGLLCLCARSQTFQVTTMADSGPGSLREAMTNAIAVGGGTIVFTNVSGTISLQSALPDISVNLRILGNGPANVTINGNRLHRIFHIAPGIVCNFSGLTVQGGLAGTNDPPTPPHNYSAAVYNEGTLTVSNCFLHDNGAGSYGDFSGGGAITSMGSSVVLNDVIFSNNIAHPPSALWASNVRATNCLFAKNASGDSSPISVGDSVFSDCTFYGNAAWFTGEGGGINADGNLTVLNCCITNNNGDFSTGGIYFEGDNLTISNCVINNNTADSHVGAINARGTNIVILNSSISGNQSSDPYAIVLGGKVCLSGCTIASNTAYVDNPGIGVFGTLNMTNCTISGNRSVWTVFTPGPAIENYGTIQAVNCTIAFNNYGVENLNGATFYALNTLIAANELGDFSGTLSSQGYNLIGNLNTNMTIVGVTNGNIYGVDPLLGPLQNNGGLTATHALLTGSPAIDAGRRAGAPLTDQRGVVRHFGIALDIGAFELEYWSLTNEVRIASISRAEPGNIQLRVEGPPGSSCTIQASSNLLNWENLFVCGSNSMGAWDFIDHDASNYPKRFYRALIGN